jgi:uncharacterized paraquat-inducible protein A
MHTLWKGSEGGEMNIKDISCPECDHRLKLRGRPHRGQRLICPECEVSLTIISLSPVELDTTVSVNHSAQPKKESHTIEMPCLECDDLIKLNVHTYEGHRLLCSGCHTTLEVVSTNPLELDVALAVNYKHIHRSEFEERRRTAKKPGQVQGHKR